MNAKKLVAPNRVLAFAVLLGLSCGCHHGIDPSEIEFPPENTETVSISKVSREQADKELAELNKVPYPRYTIQSGDMFKIRVYNEPELSTSENATGTVITPDGYLVMDLLDPIFVKNLTLNEATDKIKEALRRYVKHPQVSLIPQKINGKTATLYGAIQSPGEYPVNENTRLTSIFALGRGADTGILDDNTIDLSDFSNSYIIRDDKMLPVDFNEALVRGNQRHNIRIFPNDIVYIAKKEDSRVTIIGEVRQPRMMNWTEGLTVIDVIGYAGGLSDDYWSKVLIIRKPRDPQKGALDVYKVDIDYIIAGKMHNYIVNAGDIVYVPKDALGEYNVFVRKLMPTAQLMNLVSTPVTYWTGFKN